MSISVAVVMGSRLNAWHGEVLRHLASDIAVTAFNTTSPRYPAQGLGVPVESLAWDNEIGSWPRRKLLNLRYRLSHRRTGFEFELAPAADRLAAFDLIHTWELFTPWTLQALETRRVHRTPVLVTVWDILPFNHARDAARGRRRARALIEADRFLVASERAAATLAVEGVSAQRILRLKPAVDVERFRPSTTGRSGRERFAMRGDDEVVLAVARLEWEKGLEFLIYALGRLAVARPRLKLVLVGSGPDEARLRDLAGRAGVSGRVVFLGEQDHAAMPQIYALADVFVLASVPGRDWQEQWGQSLLEAMAMGVPVVASLSGAIAEVVGDAGVLVQAGDFLDLAGALQSLLDDQPRRAKIAREARLRVEREYASRDRGAELSAIYRELVAARGRR